MPTPIESQGYDGRDRPRHLATTLSVLAVVTVVVSGVAFVIIGNRSREGSPYTGEPSVNLWPAAWMVLVSGIVSAVLWYAAAVILRWLAARYEQAERLGRQA